jgi:hypothetical protein
MSPYITFHLGTLTLTGYVLFEMPTETCYMLIGDLATVRIAKISVDKSTQLT